MSGSGKTTFVRQIIRRRQPKRQILWDPDEDHQAIHIRSRARFARELSKAYRSGQPFRLALVVDANEANFEWWAGCIRPLLDARRPILVVAEEISDVTRTAKAPPNWGTLARRGRKWGCDVIATTQRPQEADKTIVTQAGILWSGFLKRPEDRKAMASELDVPVSRLEKLKRLEYLRRDVPEPAQYGCLTPGR
jgi:hypothetical protein